MQPAYCVFGVLCTCRALQSEATAKPLPPVLWCHCVPEPTSWKEEGDGKSVYLFLCLCSLSVDHLSPYLAEALLRLPFL